MPRTPLEYRLTADDVIVSVDGPWDPFALANDGASVLETAVVGTPLWEWVDGAEPRMLLGRIFHKVRECGVPVSLPYRCDSADTRRYHTLEVRPCGDGGLVLTHHVLREEPRDTVPEVIEGLLPDPGALLRMCSWCNALDTGGGQWVELEEAVKVLPVFLADVVPAVTHTICERCEDGVLASLDAIPAAEPPPQPGQLPVRVEIAGAPSCC